jgi:hypothetical protein
MNSMKKFDEDLPSDRENDNMAERAELNNTTLQDLGFGPEDDDELQGSFNFIVLHQHSKFKTTYYLVGTQCSHPTPANAMAASASAGYEIPQRLRTLHNLVHFKVLIKKPDFLFFLGNTICCTRSL